MRKLLLFYLFCLVNMYVNASMIESQSADLFESDTTSIPIKFDLLLDETVNADDPRVKSIIYSSKTIKGSMVKISYQNPNAASLGDKLAQMLIMQGLVVVRPHHISNTNNARYVLLWLEYPKASNEGR